MAYLPEPPFQHDQAARIGIVLINLGTPEAPTAQALRPYLKQFLLDPRVVEIPRLIWRPILQGIILNTRPKKSAKKYASIWTKDGSPLRVFSEKQAKLLQGYFAHGEQDVRVEYAMRYGQPDVLSALQKLKAAQCTRILALPLYPQYSAAATASAFDAVATAIGQLRNVPELRLVRNFHDRPEYIRALATSVMEHWRREGQAAKLVMSFHGVPRFALDKGDPYHCECHKTARLLAEALQLKPEQYVVTFQSRFGRTEWLKPYTEPTLIELAKQGTESVDVICPGFVSDCLETLEEIAQECRAAFMGTGGKRFAYVPCLNERPDFIAALHSISSSHMMDWLQQLPADAAALAQRQQRASRLGAKN